MGWRGTHGAQRNAGIRGYDYPYSVALSPGYLLLSPQSRIEGIALDNSIYARFRLTALPIIQTAYPPQFKYIRLKGLSELSGRAIIHN
jgi:hypothetical protein